MLSIKLYKNIRAKKNWDKAEKEVLEDDKLNEENIDIDEDDFPINSNQVEIQLTNTKVLTKKPDKINKCLLFLQYHYIKKNMKVELSEEEWELIDSIRNYKKIYPPSLNLELYIDYLVDKLME